MERCAEHQQNQISQTGNSHNQSNNNYCRFQIVGFTFGNIFVIYRKVLYSEERCVLRFVSWMWGMLHGLERTLSQFYSKYMSTLADQPLQNKTSPTPKLGGHTTQSLCSVTHSCTQDINCYTHTLKWRCVLCVGKSDQ